MINTVFLVNMLKEIIVSTMNLDINPNDIDSNAPLFGQGLGLDSIDALELGIAIESKFGVPMGNARNAYQNVSTLAEYLSSNMAANANTVD